MLHVANMTTFAKLYDEIVAMLEGTGNIGALAVCHGSGDRRGHARPRRPFHAGAPAGPFRRRGSGRGDPGGCRPPRVLPLRHVQRNPWLDPLRHRTDFLEIVRKAEHRHQEARAVFIQAGGEALLGVCSAAA